MELQPEQFGHLMGTDKGVRGKSVAALADTYYKREPEYMNELEQHVKENGFQTPVGIRHDPRKNKFGITYGHHRAAVAHKLGVPMPIVDLDEVPRDQGFQTAGKHESWNVERNPEEQRARYNMGERGDKGYKTELK